MADGPTLADILAGYQPQPAQRETTYGPFGEKYDVEPANVGNPLGAIVGLRSGFPSMARTAISELGKHVDAKRLLDIQGAKNALGETGDYGKTLAGMPEYLKQGFHDSLPWHERLMAKSGWGSGNPWTSPAFWAALMAAVPAAGLGSGWLAGKGADALMSDAQKTRDLESRYGLRKWLVNGPEPGIPTLPNEPY